MTLTADIHDFHRRDLSFEEKTRPVLTTGNYGPAIIVMHELYGFTPTLARFCRWVRDAGFRVYAPILLGTADATNTETVSTARLLRLSMHFARIHRAARPTAQPDHRLAPSALAHQAQGECGGPGVGAIGLCLTGGFALSMAIDPLITAPVLGRTEPAVARTPSGIGYLA